MNLRQLLPAAALLLGACASTPPADTGPTPNQVVLQGLTAEPVHWGGQIVKVKNLRDRSLIEVLAFPLSGDGRPRVDAAPQGRFIVEQAGFLEPREYARDRLLEVRGRLDGFTDGRVGEAAYRYPVVVARELQLWERPRSAVRGPRVTPRIGIGIGSGGTSIGGGIGIGF